MASAKTDEKARRRARRSWGSISAADRRLRRRPSTRNCDALISVSSPPPSLSDPAGSGAPSGWPRRENRFGQREALDRVDQKPPALRSSGAVAILATTTEPYRRGNDA